MGLARQQTDNIIQFLQKTNGGKTDLVKTKCDAREVENSDSDVRNLTETKMYKSRDRETETGTNVKRVHG